MKDEKGRMTRGEAYMEDNEFPLVLDEPDPPTGSPARNSQRLARTLLAIFVVGIALYTQWNFVPALLWGGVFAIAAWPLYDRAERRFGRSDWLPLIFTLIIALIFLIPLAIVGVKAAEEMRGLIIWIDQVRHTGIPMPEALNRLPFRHGWLTAWWQENLVQPDRLSELVHSFDSARGMAMTRQVGSQMVRRTTLFLFSLLTLFFLLRDGHEITRRSLIASHRTFGARGETLGRQIISSVHGTVAGLIFVGLGEGVIMGVAYAILHAPQPLLFGMVTAVAAMVPFLALPTVIFAAILVMLQGSMISAIALVAIGSVVIFVADHFIRPFLIGGSTRMPFLWVLLGIIGGAETWGLLGLFLGPAIMAALHMLWRIWSSEQPISD
ncbi:AI-2E family transporter [Acidomonas methanolica]|uniref:AI-2E family transporter n=1 Tax=Acidomonas methanolica TaxID=437 RepID=UPI00211A6C6F|nr:AI-2E family transporter [Acidomonas methanolica]